MSPCRRAEGASHRLLDVEHVGAPCQGVLGFGGVPDADNESGHGKAQDFGNLSFGGYAKAQPVSHKDFGNAETGTIAPSLFLGSVFRLGSCLVGVIGNNFDSVPLTHLRRHLIGARLYSGLNYEPGIVFGDPGSCTRVPLHQKNLFMAVRIASQAEPIPGYKLIERLGGGGFGEVWKAVAPGGLLKAIKFVYGDLQASNEEGLRAEQELKALSRVKSVRHPYILSLERYDILEGQLVIVMELADRNLYDRLKDCRSKGLTGIPREELLRYMEESAEALDLMNIEYQLQHLDIKPQNIFLIHSHVKVADFGLVKDLAGMMASLTGGVTPVYAAPETFDGWVSRFCDQYSLAIVYQELLTGIRPFASSSVAQLIQQHLKSAPNLTPLPPGDREIIGRALAKNPDERFPSCLEMVRALRAAGPETSRMLRPGTPLIHQGPMLSPPLPAPEQTGGDGVISRVTDQNRQIACSIDSAGRKGRAVPHTGNTQWLQAGLTR